jgi:outer membrane protein OmpA-like peptidoglycan-associated protein
MRIISQWVVVLSTLVALSGVASARKLQNYVVQRGDTCWNIAERFIGDGKKYNLIHKHNKLGPPPHLLKEGTLLKLPARPAPGKVSWLRSKVNAKGPRAPHWQRARRHMSLWRLYKIATDKGSSAGIEFTNHSRLQMRESALLVIYGNANKSLKLAKKRVVRLERGEVRGGLDALDKRARLTLKTPAAKIALASRDAQIEVDEKKRSRVSVFDGSAAVTARGKTVQVPTGHGLTVAKGQRPKKPTKLLPAPRWKGRRKQLKVILPGERGRFEASWRAVPGAKRYRFVLANNHKLQAPIADAVVGAGITRFRVERLKPGSYWARVQAIDTDRLSSRSSSRLRLEVKPLRSSRRLLRDKQGRIQVVGAAWVAVDGFSVSAGSGPFQTKPVLVKGRGAVRLGVQSAGFGARFLTLQVVGIQAAFKVKDRVIDGGGSTTIDITAILDSGAATFVPGLTVNCGDGALPLRALAVGSYRATLKAPPQAAASMLACKVYWLGGKLGATQVIVRYNEQAAKAYAKKRAELRRLGKLTQAMPRRRRGKAAPPDSIAQAQKGDPDPDVDGVMSPADKCPNEPEDIDGFEDEDGCPDLDNDRDGVPDATDKCPLKAETVNGIKDDDGCPDQGAAKASIKGGKVSITERVYFASGRDTVSARSLSLLRQIAQVLKANWQVREVRIEGHTDDRGDDELNVDLSQRRAESVQRALMRYGVAAHRLVAKGFGPTKPVKSNKSRAGRAANRRVLFIVTKVVKPGSTQ